MISELDKKLRRMALQPDFLMSNLGASLSWLLAVYEMSCSLCVFDLRFLGILVWRPDSFCFYVFSSVFCEVVIREDCLVSSGVVVFGKVFVWCFGF